MSLTNDVSWTLLRRIVRDWLGQSVELEGVRPLHGGSMSTTLLLTLQKHGRVVLKIAPHMVMHQYEQEAYQLNLLRDWGLPCPVVHSCKVGHLDDPHSYLLMQYMPGEPLSEAREHFSEDELNHLQMHLAEIALTLHGRTSQFYRKVNDGSEEGTRDFHAFFRSMYDPILKDVHDMRLLPTPLRRRIESIHGKLEQILVHDDRPRLIHGDLWSANLLCAPDRHGKWWITGLLDPNCRYSHAEIELAYLELFRTATPAFFRVYEQTHRLPDEYKRFRRDLYMLYPLLNHVRLFGHQYVSPLGTIAERLAKTLATRRVSRVSSPLQRQRQAEGRPLESQSQPLSMSSLPLHTRARD